MKKHLKYIDGTSDKFWQIEVTSNYFTVTYGKNGTSGVSQIKSFDTNEACLKAAEKLLAEKIKKGYSENGEVTIADKIDKKTGKTTNVSAILEEFDAIIKQKNSKLILPFLEKNAKGNLEVIRKHIKKCKKHWMTYVDLSNEPEYRKSNKNLSNWGKRGDDLVAEIITLSAIATFDKTDINSFFEALDLLENAQKPHILEILNWAKPNWIGTFIVENFKKSEWLSFNYKSLRFLEDNGFVTFEPELFGLCLARYNSWQSKIEPRNFIDNITKAEIAFKRDVPLLFEYETNIDASYFSESPNASYNEFNTWDILFKTLIDENKLDKKTFVEKAILIQTKEWRNNLKLFFRKIIADLNLSPDDFIPFQENIFTFLHNSNPTIANYGADLIKKIYDHPKFKSKVYLEWAEGLMMRNDCKAAIKNSFFVFEKLSKINTKLNKTIALLIADTFVIPDLAFQEKATKLLLKIGTEKDKALSEKIVSYSDFLQGNLKLNLSKFISEENNNTSETEIEKYEINGRKENVLLEEVEFPKDWNDILILIGQFISTEDTLESELILNVFISQLHLFPANYTQQLQPYLKQLEKNYFSSIQKIYIKSFLIYKIPNKNLVFNINDNDITTLNTLRLIKPLLKKVLKKNHEGSKLPLLSLPTHKPHWVAPKTLVERLIQYQEKKEVIDYVDLSIAISRMPRENTEEALPLLGKLKPEMQELMLFCLGVSNEIKITSSTLLSKLMFKVSNANEDIEKLAVWAVAARTYYPNETFNEFENTTLKNIPFVTKPFVPEIYFKEKWSEWRNYNTKEIERSPSWTELTYSLPEAKKVPQNFIYNLDLHPKKERSEWYSDYWLNTEENAYFWNSIMPQNNEPLAQLLLSKNCKNTDGANNELKGFLNITNANGFQFSPTASLVFACCFFVEKKDIRLLASEVFINLIEKQKIDTQIFSEKIALLITNKYGVLLRFIDAIIASKDVSAKHNSALFFIFDGIFKKIELTEKLPTNFKKLVENYLDLLIKTKEKPSEESLLFFEKYKNNSSLKSVIKQLQNT